MHWQYLAKSCSNYNVDNCDDDDNDDDEDDDNNYNKDDNNNNLDVAL